MEKSKKCLCKEVSRPYVSVWKPFFISDGKLLLAAILEQQRRTAYLEIGRVMKGSYNNIVR